MIYEKEKVRSCISLLVTFMNLDLSDLVRLIKRYHLLLQERSYLCIWLWDMIVLPIAQFQSVVKQINKIAESSIRFCLSWPYLNSLCSQSCHRLAVRLDIKKISSCVSGISRVDYIN